MTIQPLRSTTSTIDIYIRLAQYPILAEQIRERMREVLYATGIVDAATFEAEVKQLAIESQRREGIVDPYAEEPTNVWHERKARIRAFHTDFYFGYNMPRDAVEQVINEVLREQRRPEDGYIDLAFNPEVAPWEMLFRQGEIYEKQAPTERKKVDHHLEEIKVVLIKGMISDQLPFIGVAKKVFTIADLKWIYERRIGTGKIGGKAAGMLLAWRICQQRDPQIGSDISDLVKIPESYFLGTEVLYEFRRLNNLDHYMNQKYRQIDEIRADYESIVAQHVEGKFPGFIIEQLREILQDMGNTPLIVRSSSLLEDNFGYAFAGKYQSYFCPNQGSEKENLQALLEAIARIYASALNPDAILYRTNHGLLDYDERMAILIQEVKGNSYHQYFMPVLAGVGYSENPFRWNPKIRREDGFLRLVWGMGTRAVDRVSNDYPRMIALSHPRLRPETSASAIQRYSQHFVDVIDLQDNVLKTLPVHQVLQADYPYLRYLVSLRQGDSIGSLISPTTLSTTRDLVLTFNHLVGDEEFLRLMRTTLQRLQATYKTPVDIEFTVEIESRYPQPVYRLQLLQCRPLSTYQEGEPVSIPASLPAEDELFRTVELIPDGQAKGIRYIIFIDPRKYRLVPNISLKQELGRAIGRLNHILRDETFILMGPGRWGSANIDLGVRVTYADIFNTKVLIEMSIADVEGIPELSYGTHFFQDLIEGGIHSLPLHLENPRSSFNWAFFDEAPNKLNELSPQDAPCAKFLKVVDVAEVRPGHRLTILMDGSNDEAVGFLEEGNWKVNHSQTNLFIPG